MEKQEKEKHIKFMLEIADYAGRKIKENFDREKSCNYKEDKTPVTEIDKDINHYLIEQTKKVFPDHTVLGEEESLKKDPNKVFVCDPIDGTGMFTNKVPVSVFSLAYIEDKKVQIGIVYDPFLDKMYAAAREEGAYCNDQRIHVNNLHLGELGYRLNYEMWNKAEFDTMAVAKDMLEVARISSIGSVARSCMAIASGEFSCDLFPGVVHGNCDIAASSLIVEEAGGKVTNIYGEEQEYDKDIQGAIISNGVSHEEVLERVKKYIKKKEK